jgi:hypothetical protein
MFNRANIGFNRKAKWNRVILPAERHVTDPIPVYFRTRTDLTLEIGGRRK